MTKVSQTVLQISHEVNNQWFHEYNLEVQFQMVAAGAEDTIYFSAFEKRFKVPGLLFFIAQQANLERDKI